MQIVRPEVRLIEQEHTEEGILRHIEICARNCYRSESKEDNPKKFVESLINRKHLSMLEHGTVYLTLEGDDVRALRGEDLWNYYRVIRSPYSRLSTTDKSIKIDTNYRVLYENNALFLMKYMSKDIDDREKRLTFLITTNIGVSREANRHRTHTVAEESTRYCNYRKDKFGNSLTYCPGSDMDIDDKANFVNYCDDILHNEDINWTVKDFYKFIMAAAEYAYLNLIRKGETPQQARFVLPLGTKTSLIHTATESQWRDFIDKRLLGTTGTPHPDMVEVANLINNKLKTIK